MYGWPLAVGAVWALGTGNGVLLACDETTGTARASSRVGAVTRFASPVILPGVALLALVALVATRSSLSPSACDRPPPPAARSAASG